LKGTVAFCEALGADTLIHVRMVDGSVLIVRTDDSPMETSIAVGLAIAADGIMSFDAEQKVI